MTTREIDQLDAMDLRYFIVEVLALAEALPTDPELALVGPALDRLSAITGVALPEIMRGIATDIEIAREDV